MLIVSSTASSPLTGEALSQRLSRNERHGVVRHTVHVTSRQYGNDVRMLESGRECDLSLESLYTAAGGILGQHLDDDLASQRHLGGHENAGHPAATELTLDAECRAKCGLQLLEEVSHEAGCRADFPRTSAGPSGTSVEGKRAGVAPATRPDPR